MLRRIRGAAVAAEEFQSRHLSGADADVPRSDGGGIYERSLNPDEFAQRIIDDVRNGGDQFLKRVSRVIDGVEIDRFEVPRDIVESARYKIDHEAWVALGAAAERVFNFQLNTMPNSWRDDAKGYGELVQPIQSVGCCIPSGTAPLASTVMMTALVAKAASVPYVSVVVPPRTDGLPHQAVLAACDIAGVDQVFAIGGAQGVAALAVGTESIPRVDMICGPGNIWVTAAKRNAFGLTGIDGIYGPTETMVIIDDEADPEIASADLLAQAEHDPLAVPVLVALSEKSVQRVEQCLAQQLSQLSRASIARAALQQQGVAVIVDSIDEALETAKAFAPEHLCLAFKGDREKSKIAFHAGGIFIGELSGEIMADYIAGPSHVMPTSSSARWASALSARNFVRVTPFLDLDEATFMQLSTHASTLAKLESLDAHSQAAEIRRRKLIGE